MLLRYVDDIGGSAQGSCDRGTSRELRVEGAMQVVVDSLSRISCLKSAQQVEDGENPL